MALFNYTVANQQNKRLSGSIEATDEATARAELNSLGFSILEIKQVDETVKPDQKVTLENLVPKDHKKFVFEGINPQGQKITGTIASPDEFAAFKRLSGEYELTVTAIWKEGSSNNEIIDARIRGTYHLTEALNIQKQEEELKNQDLISQDQQKKEILVKTRVEYILKQVNELILEYDKDIQPDKRLEINQKIDKLLRIKNSTNLDYIIATAEELLEFIKDIEISIKQKNYLEKRTKLKLQIKNMLAKLHETGKPKTLSEDIIRKIQSWQQKNISKTVKVPFTTRLINNLFLTIKKFFEVPEEIQTIKSQIRGYNSQLFEYTKVYLREPAKEYKAKAVDAIKTIWEMRKKAVRNLRDTKAKLREEARLLKEQNKKLKVKDELETGLLEEFTEFTGWLIAFYLIYYFVSLYITSKDFGLGPVTSLPKSLNFHSTAIFKYIMITTFLLHAAFTVKTNFFEKTKIASLIIFPITGFFIIFLVVNF